MEQFAWNMDMPRSSAYHSCLHTVIKLQGKCVPCVKIDVCQWCPCIFATFRGTSPSTTIHWQWPPDCCIIHIFEGEVSYPSALSSTNVSKGTEGIQHLYKIIQSTLPAYIKTISSKTNLGNVWKQIAPRNKNYSTHIMCWRMATSGRVSSILATNVHFDLALAFEFLKFPTISG